MILYSSMDTNELTVKGLRLVYWAVAGSISGIGDRIAVEFCGQ
jgi:hypothetical protein